MKGIVRGLNIHVSTHSRPKAAGVTRSDVDVLIQFQHTAARRRLAHQTSYPLSDQQFQHTAARRRLEQLPPSRSNSTAFQHTAARRRLVILKRLAFWDIRFQHTAARRRLEVQEITSRFHGVFQHTAARRRLAQDCRGFVHEFSVSSTHSRPKAAGAFAIRQSGRHCVSTHSRPKAAGATVGGLPRVL